MWMSLAMEENKHVEKRFTKLHKTLKWTWEKKTFLVDHLATSFNKMSLYFSNKSNHHGRWQGGQI